MPPRYQPPPPAITVRTATAASSPVKEPFAFPSFSVAVVSLMLSALKRRNLIENLLAVRRLLNLAQTSATAIGNASFGDLVVGNRVVAGNIARTHDTGDVQHTQFVVHAHFLRSADDKIAVRQRVGDDGRNLQTDIFAALDGALALRLAVGMSVDRSIHVAASA